MRSNGGGREMPTEDSLLALLQRQAGCCKAITTALSPAKHQVDHNDLQQCVRPAEVKISCVVTLLVPETPCGVANA